MAQQWQDYTLKATLRSTDNDGIGLVFNYQGPNNFYKVDFDHERSLSKLFLVENGVETTLATVSGPGYTPGAAMQVEVTVSGGEITVLRDGVDVGQTPPANNPIAPHLAFAIDDWIKVRDALEARGLEVLAPNEEMGQMWVQDPDGYVIELIVPQTR